MAEFVDIDVDFCRGFNESEMDFCGDIANKALKMPFGIDDLPLCPKHIGIFSTWTEEDTIREIVDIMTEEESIRNLREELDDDF